MKIIAEKKKKILKKIFNFEIYFTDLRIKSERGASK